MHVRLKTISQMALQATLLVSAGLGFSACGFKADDSSASRKPIAAYCPYIPTQKSYANAISVTGHAVYEYRVDGNGIIPDGTNAYAPVVPASQATTTFGLTVNGTPITYTCVSPCTTLKAVNGLSTAFIAASLSGLSVTYNMTAIAPYRTSGSGAITLTAPVNMTVLDARPIRYAEVRVTADDGTIVQCAETDVSGNFTAPLPPDGSHYNVSVMSRASNALNTAYIMNSPNDNSPYALTGGVQSAVSTSVSLRAPATGTLLGGAFNIMDQIANAQAYLRAQTATCDSAGSAFGNYFSGCLPVTAIPVVNTYWTAGLTPGVYFGSSNPISYYLNGQRELYILGGVGGDTTVSDMDHFDNSVIVHEYGHFIEDQFGKPNSPGGSHNGNAIIDQRLAWGEGWANYFQAAVSGIPVYRDTTGYVNCGASCSPLVSFKEPLETGTQFTMHDQASTLGEGNFREFSISRLLWAISKPLSGLSQFSEIWTALNGTSGMRVVNDAFKSVSRFHVIHSGMSGSTSWASAVTAEKQVADFSGYATPFSIAAGCVTATSMPMSINVVASDDGSFAASNQFSNNDFYIYHHSGGSLPISISWSGGSTADLDLYVYKVGYVFGDSSSIVAKDNAANPGVTGSAAVAPNLPAGDYMINVMAYTGGYGTTGTRNTSYTMQVMNHAACPSSL